jgi:quercetin 2,3-dioxygenase
MIYLRRSHERGHADHGWLNSKHTFSFANYNDPKHMGFSVLRVINEDQINGGTGFSTHGHRDMEIISYVVEGALEHKDSMGNSALIQPNEVQRMSAGTGIKHSEYNHLQNQVTHFLQIWILPEKNGIAPSYDQKVFKDQLASGDLVLVGSKNGRDGSITINQDVDMYACKTKSKGKNIISARLHRKFWVQVIRGEMNVNGERVNSGDGVGLQNVESVNLEWGKNSEFILFDLP